MMPRWGQSVTQKLFGRETGRRGDCGLVNSQHQPQRDLLQHIDFQATSTAIPLPPAADTAGLPIVVKFNKNSAYNNCQLLAIGGEEGFVTIASTENLGALQKGVLDGSWRPRAHWPCHRNSIFDLAWAKSDSVIYTASGHQQVGVWDTDTATCLASAQGHEGSVKSVSPLSLCEDIFATGARDGRLALWDARCPGFSGQAPAAGRHGLGGAPLLSPVWVQDGAHTRAATTTRRSSQKIAKPAPVTVTSVAFVPNSYLLASAGAQDTVVKLWDLRMHGLPMCDLELPPHTGHGRGTKGKADAKHLPHEVASFSCPTGASAVGVTHLTVSESGDRLLVSCLDSQHHLFSLSRLNCGPIVTWRAPPPAGKSSFYMRSAFSPCGDYVLCGSKDCGAHIWSIANPERPPISLPHEHEVTGVAWSSGDWSKVATCSDSGEARVWTLDRLPARQSERAPEELEGHVVTAAVVVADAVLDLAASEPDLKGVEYAGGISVQCSQRLQRIELLCADSERNGAPLSVQPTTRAAKPMPLTPAAEAATRFMVPSFLHFERTPRMTPVPAPPAPSAASTPGHNAEATLAAGGVVPQAAADAGNADGGKGTSSVEAAAALNKECRATAGMAASVRSPVSAGPAQPATSARRRGPLPPVPIFSPAIKTWQLRQPHDLPAAPALPGASQGRAAAAAPALSACGGLEEAMRGLAQVRTQSPARMLERREGHHADVGFAQGSAADAIAGAAVPNEHVPPSQPQLFTEISLAPPAAPQAPLPPTNSFPPPSGNALPARAPAVSPHAPGSYFRSRSRLGPFSPSHSSRSSGSSGSFGSGGGSGGTPRHQQPQGVVNQIIRNSPRPGSRSSGGGALDMTARSPQVRRHSLEGRAPAEENAVQRRLFPVSELEEEQAVNVMGRTTAWSDDPVPGASLFGDWRVHAPAPSIVADVARLLQPEGGLAFDNHGRIPPVSPSRFAYELDDGQDVGPALRHRALHPEEAPGPFDEVPAALSDSEDGADENSGPDPNDSDGDDVENAVRRRAREGAMRTPPRAAPEPFTWEAQGSPPGGVARRSVFAGDGLEEDGDVPWALHRANSGEEDFRIASRVAEVDSGDDDSDWDFDPYGDKENTPPPEPLEAPTPSVSGRTSSASGGSAGGAGTSSAMAVSPRPTRSVDRPLPVPQLEPASSVEQQLPRMISPFAVAVPPSDVVLGLPQAAAGGGASAVENAYSLHTEPTVSAGIAPGSERGVGGSGSGDVGNMPSLGREWLATRYTSSPSSGDLEADDGPARMPGPSHGSAGRRLFAVASIDVDAVQDSTGGAEAEADNPTPTKRPRRVYSPASDRDSPEVDRSPSPPRRVRSYDQPPVACPTPQPSYRRPPIPTPSRPPMPCPTPSRGPSIPCPCPTPSRAPIPCPTPSRGHRPGSVASVLASPALRGSMGRRGGGFGSRLAPAPHAGYLIPGADSVAAASMGGESPAPKVGTASRTGGRTTAAAQEYFRRRADEEREDGMMSPFGFGMMVTTPAASPAPPGAAAGPGDREAASVPRTSSRLGRSAGVEVVGSGRLRFGEDAGEEERHGAARRLAGDAGEEEGEARTIEGSVRSLSCVFGTQTQGESTIMVPCTNPADDQEEVNEGAAEGGDRVDREPQRPHGLWPIEERTVASPSMFGAALREGMAAADGSRGGQYELAGGQSREHGDGTADFGTFFGHVGRYPEQQQSQGVAGRLGFSALPLDESSRCVPFEGMGFAPSASLPGASGGGGAQRSQPPQQPRSEGRWQDLFRFSSAAVHETVAVSLSQETGAAASGSLAQQQPPQQQRPPSRLDAFLLPRMAAEPVAVGAEPMPAADAHGRLYALDQACRKPRQQTLKQCWGSVAVAAPHQLLPLGQKPAGAPPVSGHRTLGPTGLTSPRYFR